MSYLLPPEFALRCRRWGRRDLGSSPRSRGIGWREGKIARGLAIAFAVVFAAGLHAQFGPLAVGTPATQNITVTAQATGTVSTVEVLTAGATGLDFAAAPGGNCTGLLAGGQCTQPVTFTPAYPGIRMGAVVLLTSSNQVIGTAFLNGTGTGGLGMLVPSAAQSAALAGAGPGALVPAAGTAQTLAGDGQWQDSNIGDGGAAMDAELFLPSAVAVDGFGNFYIADSNHQRVRMVCAGTKTTIAGTNCPAAGTIGTVAGAVGNPLQTPSGVAIDGAGNLYIADTGGHRVLELSAATGTMTAVAGTGTAGYSGDHGPATSAELGSPFALAVDAQGNLYIADNAENVVRAVCAVPGKILWATCNAAGEILTVAGTGTAGAAGDGNCACGAQLNGPYSVAVGPSGDLFIADTQNNKVRAVCAASGETLMGASCSEAGMIFTVTGDGNGAFSGDGGLASKAEIDSPSGLALDPAGNLYIADTQNNRVRKINAATGIIITLAGNGGSGYGGDGGPALAAGIHGPYGLAFYNTNPGGTSSLAQPGDLLVADFFDHRVRSIQSNLAMVNIVSPVRQGYTSPAPTEITDPTLVTVENDGNAALDLTTLTAGANTELDTQAISGINLCADGNSLTEGTQCTVEPIFAPAAAPTLTTPSQPETGDIDVNNDVIPSTTAANSPLVISVSGIATLVNPTTVTLSANPALSAAFGATVTFTATVAITSGSGTPTGTVTFFDGTTQLGKPVQIGSGVASLAISTLIVGPHSITATYNGDNNDSTSTSAALPYTVNEPTATSVASSSYPSAILGSPITFTATVTTPAGGGVTPVGTVSFFDNTNTTLLGTATLAGGMASFTTSTLAEGIHHIAAGYNGDTAIYVVGSTSAVLNQDVQAGSTILLQNAPNPSTYGATVTLTATLTSSATTAPSKPMTFFSDGNAIGTANFTANTGVATLTISSLKVGSHTLTASYAGDDNVGPGTSNPVTQTVNKAQTGTVLSATPTTGIAGKPVLLTATVALVGGSATVTGTVTFTDNGAPLNPSGAAVGAGGIATYSAMLGAGQHSIVATYSGDANDLGSVSSALPLTVIQATTQVALTSSASPAEVMSAVVFKAVVSGNGGIPSKQVTFSVDGAAANTATLDATGTATFSDSSLAVGSHQVMATYNGDTDDAGSSSSAVTEVITAIPTATDLGTTATGGPTPQAVLVATAVGATGPVPTGTVTFSNGSTVIGSATLDSSGVATLNPDLVPGNYSIVAKYGGDSLHSPSSSQAVSITGTAAGFSIAIAPPTLSLASGQNGTMNVTITATTGFSDTVGMGCLSLPASVNCHFSTNSVKLAAGQSQTVQLTIDTNAPLSGGQSASIHSGSGRGVSLAELFLPGSLLFGFVFWRFRRRHVGLFLGAIVLFLAGAFSLSGCGASFNQITAAAGTYSIQVGGVGTGSNVSHYQNVTLTVTQ